MGASGVNWNNVPHETILSEINGGAGAGPVSDAADAYRRIASTLREADQDLRHALGASGASWEGRAAAEMQTASTPLATWADEADQLAVQTGSATEMFGDQFANTRAAMPAVVDVPSGSWVDATGLSAIPGVTTDRERAEATADAAHQEAARRMEAYDNASYDTVRTQYFAQPPAVTIEVPPPTAGGGTGVGGASTTYGGATYTAPAGWTAPGATVAPQPMPLGVRDGGRAAVPGSPTAPAGVVPTPTVPSSAVGGLPGGTGGASVEAGPPWLGGTAGMPGGYRPGGAGGGRPGSGSGGSSGPPLPPIPGMPGQPGRGLGSGGYGASPYGPGTDGPGRHQPGGSEPGHAFGGRYGAGGSGGSAGFGPRGPGIAGVAGADSFTPAAVDPDGRAAPAGRPGAGSWYGPAGAGRATGEEDVEHRRPHYLVETEDVWGDGTMVAPPVIGDPQT